jgi:two-component system sensor histidine kinase and response regulator WspE
LILDVEDLAQSVAKESAAGLIGLEINRLNTATAQFRVLVVDDSITVRELQRKLLVAAGYAVEVAADGRDAWNTLQARNFDLLIADVDMPRMDGLELTAMIRNDPRWRTLPVLLISHKDRAEDRQRGLAAGADEYLPKSGFQEENLLQSVRRLIGKSARR